jgi:DNA-binding IclR family transcriptional regulator
VAAVSVSTAAIYLDEERLSEVAAEVVRTAQRISRELGG